MAKPKSVYACAECGATALQWFGTCPSCGAAGTLSESYAERGAKRIATPSVALADIEAKELARIPTGVGELDRALGAGLVAGQVVLLGGDPGIGKSTLLLQTLATLKEVLYVTGEESAEQIAMRARRLSLDAGGVRLLAETQLERILGALDAGKPAVAVIDSIQTLWSETLQSAPGSVAQVRECAAQLTRHAKRAGTALFIIGHVTKEGTIAGPRVLEHIVDTVLYFEGERHHAYRILRAVKNRFGPTNEIGMFEMRQTGFVEVENPSELLLAERPQQASGSVVVASMEGTRPLLVELQALGSPSGLGLPRRVANGVDHQRVALLLAVLEKRFGLPLQAHDVYVNVVGGLYIEEPAIDLGVVVAVVSSLRDAVLDPHLVVLGEVGLTGEVRAVGQVEARLREAAKLGFRRCLLPQANCQPASGSIDIELCGIRTVAEALQVILQDAPATAEEAWAAALGRAQ